MKTTGLKKRALWLSVGANVALLSLVFYIGCVKTDYAKTLLCKLGVIKSDDKPKPDYWSVRGWTNTLEKLDLDVNVVFFGNSITHNSDFRRYFPNVSICNLGYPGDGLSGMLLRVDQIKAVNPKKVFVMAGINGLVNQSEDEFKTMYTTLVDSIRHSVPKVKIYLQSMLPVNPKIRENFRKHPDINSHIVECNTIIADIARREGCVYIDLYFLYAVDEVLPETLAADGLHLNPEAYDRWAELIRPYVE